MPSRQYEKKERRGRSSTARSSSRTAPGSLWRNDRTLQTAISPRSSLRRPGRHLVSRRGSNAGEQWQYRTSSPIWSKTGARLGASMTSPSRSGSCDLHGDQGSSTSESSGPKMARDQVPRHQDIPKVGIARHHEDWRGERIHPKKNEPAGAGSPWRPAGAYGERKLFNSGPSIKSRHQRRQSPRCCDSIVMAGGAWGRVKGSPDRGV